MNDPMLDLISGFRLGCRPIHLRKETERDRRWRRFQSGPLGWLWRCYVCNLEATYSAATLPGGYADALEHLEDEHLGAGVAR